MAPAWLPPPDGSRDARIEDPTNLYFVHLSGRALLPLALRIGLSPNPVSVTGFVLGAGAAAAYYHWRDPRMACLGLVLCVLWLIADGLDGMIARATGRASAFGRFLDGLCDHGVFLLLYLSLATSIGTVEAWVLAIAAGAAHAVQATLYEGERTRFHRRLKGDAGSVAGAPSANPLVRLYDRVAGSLDRFAAPLDERLRAAADPRAFGEAYAAKAVPPLRLMSLLTNNMRVLTIFLACLAGDPRWFWITELTVQTALLVIGTVWLRRVEGAIVREATGS
jgi:hypothetical protein